MGIAFMVRLFFAVLAFGITTPSHASDHDGPKKQQGRKYDFSEEPYSPYNPLWREEQVYTGERRGPVTSLRRPRRTPPPAHSLLEPHIEDTDDVSAASIRSISTGVPLHGAIDMGSSTRGQPNYHNRRDSSRRKKWRRRRSRLSIDFSPIENTKDTPTMRRKGFFLRFPIQNHNSTIPHKAIQIASKTMSTADGSEPRLHRTSRRKSNDNNVEVSMSLDLGSLLHAVVAGSTNIASVYIGMLKLLGPMMFAKQSLVALQCFLQKQEWWSLKSKGQSPPPPTPAMTEHHGQQQQDSEPTMGTLSARSLLQMLCMGFVAILAYNIVVGKWG